MISLFCAVYRQPDLNIVYILEMSMLFHYKNYITSDLSAMDYIRYYRRLHGKKLSITYAYMNYMDMEDASIPMDNQLHVRKK